MTRSASRKSKKTTLAFIALLSILAIALAGWINAELKPSTPGSLPGGLYRWTEYFHGYEAYLDQRIYFSIVTGASMSPTFRDNDLAMWVRVDTSLLKVGDIIIFAHPTRPYIDNVVHRIVEIQLDGGKYAFRTKGDSSSLDSYLVPEANVHGLVIGVIYHDDNRFIHNDNAK